MGTEQHIENMDDQEFICPHCNYKLTDSWEYISDLNSSYLGHYAPVECPECEVEFEGMVEISHTYYSQVKQDKKPSEPEASDTFTGASIEAPKPAPVTVDNATESVDNANSQKLHPEYCCIALKCWNSFTELPENHMPEMGYYCAKHAEQYKIIPEADLERITQELEDFRNGE